MIVVPGCRWAVASVTNRPVIAERLTVVLFDVPRPMVSVVVVRGLRRAVEALTKRPLLALLLTVRAMWQAPNLGTGPYGAQCMGALGLGSLAAKLDPSP